MQNRSPGLRFLQFPTAERGGKDWMRIERGERFRSNGKVPEGVTNCQRFRENSLRKEGLCDILHSRVRRRFSMRACPVQALPGKSKAEGPGKRGIDAQRRLVK